MGYYNQILWFFAVKTLKKNTIKNKIYNPKMIYFGPKDF